MVSLANCSSAWLKSKELAPVLRFIFQQSLLTGDLTIDWTRANVAPVFKKGSKLQAVNYRPVSLTCITYKLSNTLSAGMF